MTRTLAVTLLLGAGAMVTAAGPARAQSGNAPPATPAAASGTSPAEATAVAELKDAKGQKLGSATLRETPGGVLIEVTVSKVPPGAHAFHIHDAGKCEAPAFTTAGGHFNPDSKKHGLLAGAAGAHAGDLPNVHVPEGGTLAFEVLAPGVNLRPGDARSVFDSNGAALVLHAKADDYKTDPAGAAGDRLACGVIEKRK
jgi:Cu-Zn family superoxide dismutase